MPAALVELYARCDGATLFGRWHVARRDELCSVYGSFTQGFLGVRPFVEHPGGFSYDGVFEALSFCALTDDPRFFSVYCAEGVVRRDYCVILCDPTRAQRVEQIVVVADDVEGFFERTLEARGASWFEGLRAPTLYDRLGGGCEYLRPELAKGPPPPPADLNDREKEQLIRNLCFKKGSTRERAFWWEALRRSTGTPQSFEQLFGVGLFRRSKKPYEVMVALGLR